MRGLVGTSREEAEQGVLVVSVPTKGAERLRVRAYAYGTAAASSAWSAEATVVPADAGLELGRCPSRRSRPARPTPPRARVISTHPRAAPRVLRNLSASYRTRCCLKRGAPSGAGQVRSGAAPGSCTRRGPH